MGYDFLPKTQEGFMNIQKHFQGLDISKLQNRLIDAGVIDVYGIYPYGDEGGVYGDADERIRSIAENRIYKHDLMQFFSKLWWDHNVSRETWEQYPSKDLFKKTFSAYIENQRHIEFYGIAPTKNMTQDQKTAVFEVLAEKKPRILARHADSFVTTLDEVKLWTQLLSEKAPEEFLRYARKKRYIDNFHFWHNSADCAAAETLVKQAVEKLQR